MGHCSWCIGYVSVQKWDTPAMVLTFNAYSHGVRYVFPLPGFNSRGSPCHYRRLTTALQRGIQQPCTLFHSSTELSLLILVYYITALVGRLNVNWKIANKHIFDFTLCMDLTYSTFISIFMCSFYMWWLHGLNASISVSFRDPWVVWRY